MKNTFLLYLLLGTLTAPYAVSAQSDISVTASQKATPNQAYSQLATDVANLLKRATILSDAKALSLLRQESPSLQLRAKTVKPAYQKWVKSLSVAARQVEEKRILTSAWGKYFSDLDPKLGAKVGRNQALGQQVMDLMSLFEGV